MLPLDGVLGRIVAHKLEEVERRRRDVPIEDLRRRTPAPPRSLRAALARPGSRFVLEHKRASPSNGALGCQKSPREIARAYSGVADAVSVLTDARFFGGSFEDLRAVREAIDVPVLCKDFVVSPYQVVEARSHGADAVLIMLSVLDDGEAAACLAEAEALGMDALVEVHDEAELRRALELPAEIIGINHRDLKTLAVDLSVSERLAPTVPGDRLIVAESGIDSRRDVERLSPLVDAFLVGSSLMRAADVREAARALVLGRVKVCGLTRPEDASLAAGAGALLGGLVFAGGSPRRVTEARAEAIAAAGALPLCGVFVNEEADRVAAIAGSLGLAVVQLHGDEDAAYVGALRARLPAETAVWKVERPAAGVYTADSMCTHAGAAADRLLFDTPSAGARGGTGVPFDWRRIAAHPRLASSVLAGGIGPDNAAAARAVGAWAIDVGSRIEARPGEKDPELVARLFAALRGPGRVMRADGEAAGSPAERASDAGGTDGEEGTV